MLQLRSDMVSRVSASAALQGTLRLGAVETVGHTWLSTLLQRIHRDYPSITLQITIDNTPDLRRAVVAHELDIAFFLGPVSEARVASAPLRSYPVGWLASPSLGLPRRRLSLCELARFPILSSRPHAP